MPKDTVLSTLSFILIEIGDRNDTPAKPDLYRYP